MPPPPSQVPDPVFPSVHDIKLYVRHRSGDVTGPHLYSSSLAGQRTWADFLTLLDQLILVSQAGSYCLQELSRDGDAPLISREFPGTIAPGSYVIVPLNSRDRVGLTPLSTFFTCGNATNMIPAEIQDDHDGGSQCSTTTDYQDYSDDCQCFKMRLVHRDKGCVVCLAAGVQGSEAYYLYREDSDRFEGCHIVDFVFQHVWDAVNFAALVKDPFTDPACTNDGQSANSTTTTEYKKDPRRMNSLENGILLCLNHYNDYNGFRFAIHPETHKIFAFHPASARLQGVKVKASWDNADAMYPPPHSKLLAMHYRTSVSNSSRMPEAARKRGDSDSDSDDEEL